MATLRQLRADVVEGYRPRMFASGAVPTGGASQTTSTLYDPLRTEPEGDWDRVDTWVIFTNGANDGVERRITGWSGPSASTLTFAPILANAVASGAGYNLTKTFNRGQLNLAVNSGLRDLYPERRIITFATAGEPAVGIRTLEVPSIANNLGARLLHIERSVGTTNSSYNYETLVQNYHYGLLDANGALTMQLYYAATLDTMIRFVYEAPLTDLSADSDVTLEPPGLIILAARKYLALFEGDDAGAARWGRELELAKNRNAKDSPAARPLIYPRITVG